MPLDYNFTTKVTEALHKENADAMVSESWSWTSANENGLPFYAEISIGNKIINVLVECNTDKTPSGKKECNITFENSKSPKKHDLAIFQSTFPKTTSKYLFK